MGEGLLRAEVEVETASSAACTIGLAAASPARLIGVRVVVAVVGSRHYVASVGIKARRFEFVFCYNRSAMVFMLVFVAVSVYILMVSVCGTVDVVCRSRDGWCRGVVGIRRIIFLRGFRCVG
jgi:hypothetical protein